jgi:thiamine pyrophosphokinase
MDALLISGGDAPCRERLASRFDAFDLVCAADSGLDIAIAWGIRPGMIVGDMDSISDPAIIDAYPEAFVLRSPRDKDDSDTELGLKALAGKGARRIVLAGGGGGRLDHLLAVRALFERKAKNFPRPVEWHTAHEIVYLVEEGSVLDVEANAGTIVSVFPLAGGASDMTSEGLQWSLAGLKWGPGEFGLSNRMSETKARIQAGIGDILVVVLVA